jgi:osmoprotectant transport system ATP-binding protein
MSIELQNISKTYNSTHALKNINFQFYTDSTTVLIGPSGCGKSTLIRIIIGLISPDTGNVKVNGELLTIENVLGFRKLMGYVIQDGGLFPHLSAEDNVNIMAKYLGWDEKEIKKRISELSELTKFPVNGLKRFPSELSGGQKQRVSLMRALMLNPKFLLLDEPLGALDPLIRFDLQADLREIFKQLKKTVILVTHDMNEAAYLGDSIVLMKEGEVVQVGNIKNFIESPTNDFVKKFITAQRSIFDFEK